MDSRKWFRQLPLFRAAPCCYCGGPADTFDHTPPRCLLPKKLPNDIQAMTIPACTDCNAGFAEDEMRVAAVVCTVSFMEEDKAATGDGGWVHTALAKDASLREFVQSRMGSDGIFRPDQKVAQVIGRIMAKTATGLLFHEFGRLVSPDRLVLLGIEHTTNIHPLAFIEQHRRDDSGWAEVTPSGRELERQVQAVFGYPPKNMPPWRTYVERYFQYLLIRRSNNKLLTAMKLHDAVTVLMECPWPATAGPRRGGKPRKVL